MAALFWESAPPRKACRNGEREVILANKCQILDLRQSPFVRGNAWRCAHVVLVTCALNLTVAPLPAQTISVTVSASLLAPNAKTPEIVGYNSGHFMPGSNTADWWRYSGVNGARVWATPSVVEKNPAVPGLREDDNTQWGDGVTDQPAFLNRRALVRANPLSNAYINWPLVESNYQSSETATNALYLNHAIGQMRNLGIDPVMILDRTATRYPFNTIDTPDPTLGWQDRWEQWQHFYMQAFYLAKNFDVHRFQMYNEPNHFSSPDTAPDVTPAEFVERLQFASDAVQAAIADVNTLYGKSLDPQMQAPITAGGASLYSTWGAPVMQSLHTNFLGQVNPAFQLIDTYGYQKYDLSGPSFASDLLSVKNSVNAAAAGTPMRFALTEFSVHTAGNFDDLSETLDSPAKFARMGSILSNLANARADELYVQKFSQTEGTGPTGVKKNGTHFVDNVDAPYNIGGVTKGGEVVRLFAKGFAGANDLFAVPTASGTGASDLQLAASRNQAENRYFLLSSNEGTTARPLTINLSNWNIAAGARAIIEEVSANRHGEVSQIFTMPTNGVFNVSQPAQSVFLISIPKTSPTYVRSLTATDDAMVRSGTSNVGVNFGTSPSLIASNDKLDSAARNVTFIKFNTGSIITSEIEQAILQVNGQNTGTASQIISHVYGLTNDNWNELTINWNNAPNLKDSLGTAVNDISENFIEDIGNTAHIQGHLTGIATTRQLSLDVTDFVRDHPNQQISFLIAREVRFDGEDVSHGLTSLQLASKESAPNIGPQLLLTLASNALAGDYDHSGTVDAGDYNVWRQNFGTTNAAADGNRNGVVDTADFSIWRTNQGKSLPGAAVAVGTGSFAAETVPEPSAALLVLCVILLAPHLVRNRH